MQAMITAITTVWTEIMTWITTSLSSVQTVFYADSSLTFLGVLAVISVAIGVAFLVDVIYTNTVASSQGNLCSVYA